MTGSRRVVVVDDSPSIRETISYVLEMEGFDVHSAANGQDGIDLIRRVRPRVVLLDGMMPDLSGFEVCQQVRDDPDLRGTFVIMLTSMGQKVDLERAHEVGVDHFLTKPFDEDEVLGLLDRAFSEE
jgi:DNA-binding response OmpR family regulator